MVPFEQTIRGIERDTHAFSTRAAAVVVLVIGAWCAWFFLAKVTTYQSSSTAKLESAAAPRVVQALESATVAKVLVRLGQDVKAGEVIMELDCTDLQLAKHELMSSTASVAQELLALHKQLAAAKSARDHEMQIGNLVSAEARLGEGVAQLAATHAAGEAERLTRMQQEGVAPASTMLEAQTKARDLTLRREGAALNATRLEQEFHREVNARLLSVNFVEQEIERARGREAELKARLERVDWETDRRQVRAPVQGKIGSLDVTSERVYVHEGQRLATVVPDGTVRAVAYFRAETTMGWLHPGQRGHMRVAAFPAPEFGLLQTKVARVGAETTDGLVRVEFDVVPNSSSRIDARHGLTGTVEVAVDDVTPAQMLLRIAGAYLSANTSTVKAAQ